MTLDAKPPREAACQPPALKPCPFCGSRDRKPLLYSYEVDADDQPLPPIFILCKPCGIQLVGETEEEVVRRWNTRSEVAGTYH